MKNDSPIEPNLNQKVVARVEKADVGRRARGGVVWSVLQIGGRNLVSIITTAILARILSPDDYGLIGMVATLTALLLVFSNMGLSSATVQRAHLTEIQISNLFWVNVVAGALLWIFCVALAPSVAGFYERPELNAVTAIMGATFLLGGVAVQPFALMQRQMRFKAIAALEIAALLLGAVAGVAAAVLGYGYWSLVIQTLTVQATRALVALPFSRLGLMRPRYDAGTGSLIAFGGLLAANGLLIYLARNFDSVLIGRWWGAEALGYYNRAYFLMLLPSMLATGVLTSLMVPSLSAFQDDSARFGAAYRRAVTLVAFVGCPIAAGLALTAEEAVRIVYGEKWLPVAAMLIWLSLAGITQPIYNTTGWLFTASGKAKAYLALTLINAVMLVAAFFVAIPHGALAIAAVYGVVMGLVLLGPALWLAHRSAGISLVATGRDLLPVCYCVVAMVIMVLVVAKLSSLAALSWQLTFVGKVVTGVVVYAACSIMLLPQVLNVEVVSLLKFKRPI